MLEFVAIILIIALIVAIIVYFAGAIYFFQNHSRIFNYYETKNIKITKDRNETQN